MEPDLFSDVIGVVAVVIAIALIGYFLQRIRADQGRSL